MSRKSEIMKGLLGAVAVTGVLIIALAVPNAFLALKPFVKKKRFENWQLKRSLKSLERSKLINTKYENGQIVITLTKQGKVRLLKYKLDEMKIEPQKRWDTKWRIVIFDVPVRLNRARMYFSRKLKEMGFKLIQKSVWVYPYPCENEIDYLKEIYHVGPFVRILTCEKMDIQRDLLKHFKLD